MVAPSSLRSATCACSPLSHPPRLSFKPQFLVWNWRRPNWVARLLPRPMNWLRYTVFSPSPQMLLQLALLSWKGRLGSWRAHTMINHAQLEHLQGINNSNAFEVEHLLSKLSIANEAILGFQETFSNVEEHIVEMETLFEECNHCKPHVFQDSIIDNLVQTFQVNVLLHSSPNKVYHDVGDLAMSALLAHHADLKCPLQVIMHNVTIAHCGFEVLCQFANEADTPELEALLESISYVGFHGAWAHDLCTQIEFDMLYNIGLPTMLLSSVSMVHRSNVSQLAQLGGFLILYHHHLGIFPHAYNGTVMGVTHEDHPVNSWSPAWSEALGLPQGLV
ncbi:hypothetical protein BT96DRAFT_947886 [Gymnopus androsaceus JB14]|uniref:Uncharacterized protein n=1 Tax=Gymnopus androsaceus JB14 TaxID=1447944 RepID=A0A6A4GQN4_9AGAR|nr:hypothetical protein BT96DRAFT_947886 [Gymnopus androsaceus JB14]